MSKKNHVVNYEGAAPVEIELDQIPAVIGNQFKELSVLQKSVNDAMKKAKKAKESAEKAASKSAGLGHKKEAIESLQDATSELADSQVTLSEAQKISFEYQRQLGEISKYLFSLGLSNLAANRTVLRELEMRLRGASQKELDDLARQELLNVVKQLKAQEDIMNKQAQLSEAVRYHESKLSDAEADIERQKGELQAQAKKDEEHDKEIAQSFLVNEQQEAKLREQSEKDIIHDELISQAREINEHQEIILRQQAERLLYNDKMIQTLTKKTYSLKKS